MKIEVQSNWGRFATHAETIIPETMDQIEPKFVELLKSGLENELFRSGGSAGQKAVVALGGESLATESAPAGPIDKKTPRSSIPFSQERALALAKAMNESVNGEASKLPKIVFAVTGEYEYGKATGPSKEAKAFWVEVQQYPEARFAKALAQLGLDPESYTDAEGEAATHSYLLEKARLARQNAKGGLGTTV